MSYTIITHNGKSHMDELLGSALLALYLGEDPDTVIRMDPQEVSKMVDEGNIPEMSYLVDCGLVFDKERRLFDHHQDEKLDCAALLIFNEFFQHLFDTELHEYVKLVSKVDTKGAMSLDDFHLVSESRDYFSFSHNILLKSFENDPKMVIQLLMAGLEDKISFEKAKKVAALWRKEPGNIEIVSLDGLKVLRYLKKPPAELRSPLRSEMNQIIEEHNISVTSSFDEKVEGAETLFRTDYGHNHIDFNRSVPDQTLFCHKGGFLLKFMPSRENEWKKLVNEALVSPLLENTLK
ncbi:MAG: MYG1 family protein [Spirochaetaceae bacterium]|jgi:hypothetical protein|nr:MYG1 family protein [Spirochaetaceae bacterium]